MAQWYPKLAEYDFEGWHANAYLGREFHGVWGDFDVTIHIDKDYTIGGSGYLQNPQEVGHGYERSEIRNLNFQRDKLSWHFKAPNVHDFTWAADPEYIHEKVVGENDVDLHFFYKNDKPKSSRIGKTYLKKRKKYFLIFNKHIGQYPYKQYSVIQGWRWRNGICHVYFYSREAKILGRLIGTTAHEFAHSWFQFVLATNETKHSWMDEGFTSYISMRL